MKFVIFFCSLILFISAGFADPMLDIQMLFPERAEEQRAAQQQVKRDSLKNPVLPDDVIRRIERLEEDVRILKERLGREERSTPQVSEKSLPSVEKEHYAKALQYFNSGEYKKAYENLRLVSEGTDDRELRISALYWMAECAFRLDTYNEAVILLQEVLADDLDLFRENSMILMAVSFRNLGKSTEARHYFSMYLEHFPQSKFSSFARRELEKNP
jgi:TolA-binding protein